MSVAKLTYNTATTITVNLGSGDGTMTIVAAELLNFVNGYSYPFYAKLTRISDSAVEVVKCTADDTVSVVNITRAQDGTTALNFVIGDVSVRQCELVVSSLPPSGAAGGDLSGTYPNPSLANIPTHTPVAGDVIAVPVSAPSTPASGHATIYVDSTSKNVSVKDDAGVVKHGVQTKAAVTSNFLTAIHDDGTVDGAQPAFTDISGAAVVGQLPTVDIAHGGTGQTAKTAAFDALQPMTAAGSLIKGGASGTGLELGIGTNGDFLKVVSGLPAWATPSSKSFKLSAAAYSKVNDYDVADTLIAATAKPGSPQWTQVVGALPTDTTDVLDYMVYVTGGGKNTDGASARTINFRFTLNGTDIGTGDVVLSVPTATPFWSCAVRFGISAAIAPTDTLGAKMWASVTNVIDYRYFTVYVVPRRMVYPRLNVTSILRLVPSTAVLAGAIAGVTYSPNSVQGCSYQSLGDTTINQSNIAGSSALPFNSDLEIWPCTISLISDSNNIGQQATAAGSLYAFSFVSAFTRSNW